MMRMRYRVQKFNRFTDFAMTVKDRAIGCLAGIATGDAIGKQTESLSRQEVLLWYPHGIRGFEGRPGNPIPRYSNNRKYKWRIGEITDEPSARWRSRGRSSPTMDMWRTRASDVKCSAARSPFILE